MATPRQNSDTDLGLERHWNTGEQHFKGGRTAV